MFYECPREKERCIVIQCGWLYTSPPPLVVSVGSVHANTKAFSRLLTSEIKHFCC